MSVAIKGIDKLINKLNKISNIATKEIIEDIATDVEGVIRNKAKTFADTSYMYISKCDTRVYGLSCYVDVGLKNDNAEWDLWKGLWFHQWGYWNKGLNFSGQYYISMHQLWFNDAVNSIEGAAKKKIKDKVKSEIQLAWKG
ncbi:hypothetical protein [Fusobacterium varium]